MMAVATTIAALYHGSSSSLDSYYYSFDHQQRSSSSSSSSSPSSLFSSSPDDHLTPSLRNAGDHSYSPVSVINGGYGTRRTLLFKRFVTHVFGACVNSSRLNMDDENNEDEELMFSMDDDDEEDDDGNNYENEMLLDAQLKYNVFNHDLVVKAFHEAAKAHKGQMRASGDPYLVHCVETAGLLATIGANAIVVAAGLLHDTIDDSYMSYECILDTFGAGLADLVKGVSRLSELSKLARESNTATKIVEADRMHTMFLGMVDARAVLIKLADRLHNMMTLDALPLSKQYRFAKETMEIFAPLANRLGIVSWKEQLENLCFKYINPERYTDLSSQLLKSFNEAMVNSAAEKLEEALKDGSVCYHVLYGRHKSLYSVHCKMLKKKLSMDEIHDVHGLRLIVENKEDCYKALKVVHGLWSAVPGKFKDYINQPKCNGYRSLHTVVKGEGLVPLEVQIRTKEMHSQAEFGFAAHWRYKEGDCMHSSFVLQMVEWARWVVTWQCETMMKDQSGISFADVMKPPCKFPFHSEDCPHSYKPSCVSDGPVFVIVIENDKMSVQEFPANATVKDVLDRAGDGSYRWSPYGYSVKQELIAKLNHEAVSDPVGKLRMGDVVELTPKIPDKSLIEKREEIQRMYESGLSTTSTGRASGNRVGWRR